MIYQSRIRNLTYVIKPVHKNVVSGIVTHSDGLRVEFTGAREGTFDSSTIADEAKRKLAEDYLANHPDNGILFHVMEDPTEVPKVLNTCIGAIVGGGACGKPAQEDSDYCADCARELTHA